MISNKGFFYTKTDYNYISYYKDGQWDDGQLRKEDTLTISSMSTALHYGQQCFEGLKAYRRKDGRVQLFRIKDSAERFQMSCKRLIMPIIPVDVFIDAVKKVVRANLDFVPPYGQGESLYIRPFMIGVGDNLGLRPAPEYIFNIVVSPVGLYFDSQSKPVDLYVSDYDRAAPNGTGHVKVGGNYGASLYPQSHAKSNGFADCIFLDPATKTKIEEVGAANFFGITQNLEYITPTSNSILNGITNRSLKYIAETMCGLKVVEGDVYIDKLNDILEAAACGTAAIITPIGSITYKGNKHTFLHSKQMGPYTQKLRETLLGILCGDIEDPNGWVTIL